MTAPTPFDERLTVLDDLARSITSSLELDVVLPRITEAARQLCTSDTASIFLRDPAEDVMVPRVRGSAFPPGYEGLRVRRGEGVGGRAWEAGRPVRTPSYHADREVPEEFRVAARQAGVVAVMAVPIWIDGAVEGLLYVGNQTARAFTEAHERVCTWLAHQAAVALQNASLFTR